MHTAEIFIPISFFIVVFSILYIYLTTRSKERMALIEKGESASIFSSADKKNDKYGALKYGMLSMGIGSGFLAGSILTALLPLFEEPTYFACIFLGGGLGLISYYFIRNNQEIKDI